MYSAHNTPKPPKYVDWVLINQSLIFQVLLCLTAISICVLGFGPEGLKQDQYVLLACVGLSGPWLCGKAVNRIWNKITPLKDRPTHIESFLCYYISAFCAFVIALPLFGLSDFYAAFQFSLITILVFLPFGAAAWFLNVTYYPMEKILHEAENSQDSAAETPPKPNNIIAYVSAGLISTLVFCSLITIMLLVMRAQSFLTTAGAIIIPMTIFNALLAPFFVLIGSKFCTNNKSEGWQYTIGAIVGLFVLLATSVCRPNFEFTLEGILSQWSVLLVFGLAIIGHLAGGWILARLYRRPSIDFVFG